jgi:hypothetical protein
MTDVTITARLVADLEEAEAKAWDALARYKFQMFGYWCAIWVHQNGVGGFKRPNPWAGLVKAARARTSLADDAGMLGASKDRP